MIDMALEDGRGDVVDGDGCEALLQLLHVRIPQVGTLKLGAHGLANATI